MSKYFYVFLILFVVLFLGGCTTVAPEYNYTPGPPSASVRDDTWEGFSSPASMRMDDERLSRDFSETEENPRVLWVIADTYGNSSEMDQLWKEELPWFFDPKRTRFVEVEGTPDVEQHWHGFGCYSCGWPLLYRIPNVDFLLFRMIDVAMGEEKLFELLKEELVKYDGRVVVSNSWGVPRQGNQMDEVQASAWKPWAEKMDALAVEYPSFTMVFSSGNQGPSYSGFPQSLMSNAILVGATDKMGYIADFSSPDENLFGVAGGHRKYVANPNEAGGYMAVSGTSFSCPTVASMFVKLLAENPEWGREEAIEFLKAEFVSPLDSSEFNEVWGWGELEQYNQKVPEGVWRALGFPKGTLARIRGWFSSSPLIELPRPMPRKIEE